MLRLLLNLVLDVRCCFIDPSVLRRCVTSRYTYCHVLTAFYFFIYFFHSLCTESASKVYAILQLFVHLLLFFLFFGVSLQPSVSLDLHPVFPLLHFNVESPIKRFFLFSSFLLHTKCRQFRFSCEDRSWLQMLNTVSAFF